MPSDPADLIDSHADAVEPQHRFSGVTVNGSVWDLSHLNAFALRAEIETNLTVDVVVLFSCHCFTHSELHDPRSRIPMAEFFWDGRERRVLNPERYRLSKTFLPRLIRELPSRHIRVLASSRNFFTTEATDSDGKPVSYAVFFIVEKDRRRRKRLLLRVQSAYPIERLDNRQAKAGKVNFAVLLRAAHAGKPIRG